MAEIAGEGGKAVRGVGEFQHLGGDEGEAGFGVEVGRECRKLLNVKIVELYSSRLLARNKIERQAT